MNLKLCTVLFIPINCMYVLHELHVHKQQQHTLSSYMHACMHKKEATLVISPFFNFYLLVIIWQAKGASETSQCIHVKYINCGIRTPCTYSTILFVCVSSSLLSSLLSYKHVAQLQLTHYLVYGLLHILF